MVTIYKKTVFNFILAIFHLSSYCTFIVQYEFSKEYCTLKKLIDNLKDIKYIVAI